jgi:hypothetical protein
MIEMNLGKRIGILGTVLAFTGGCSGLAPDEDTYNTVIFPALAGGSGGSGQTGNNAGSAGQTGQGGGLLDTPPWSCLRPGGTMVVTRGAPSRIRYQVPIVDFDSLTPVAGLVVQACTTSNCDPFPACDTTTPAPTQQCAIVSGPAGALYVIDLPWNFTGGLKLTKPGEYAEMDYFFGGPMVGLPEIANDNGGDLVQGLPIPVLKLTARQRAYDEVGGGVVDIAKGTLAVRVLNCVRNNVSAALPIPQGTRAAGVSINAVPMQPAGSVPWTLSTSNFFTPNLTVTDNRGVAGYLQAPPITMSLQAELDDVTLITPKSFRVRENVITLAELRAGLDQWGQ